MELRYQNVLLRDYRESDIEDDVRWNTVETAWLDWDAPWEKDENFDEQEYRKRLHRHLLKPRVGLRRSLEIDTSSGIHLGSVSAYCIDSEYSWSEAPPEEKWKSTRWAVGLSICESSYWSGGWGTQALTAYVRYLLSEGYEDLYTQTWSGNERMIGLARKLGFRECCRKKGIREVKGRVYDGLTFRLDHAAFAAHCVSMLERELELYIPKVEDLWFTRKLQENPATMSYNAGWDVSYEGYHPDTGCIDFPPERWAEKHEDWVGHEPNRLLAYIREKKTGTLICEVNFHYTAEKDWWDMGILMDSSYRGKGLSRHCLELLLHRAFVVNGIAKLHNDFETEREIALAIHKEAGFTRKGERTATRFGKPIRTVDLILTREDYLSSHPEY